ncbi:MAG: hypothetical protein HC793_00530 [Aquincola sp.]|nr:hypothetical protein [Aquincola sp.]
MTDQAVRPRQVDFAVRVEGKVISVFLDAGSVIAGVLVYGTQVKDQGKARTAFGDVAAPASGLGPRQAEGGIR